jgi:hypothetical protein
VKEAQVALEYGVGWWSHTMRSRLFAVSAERVVTHVKVTQPRGD